MERYYIPVCLYPHTKYRTKAGIEALSEKFCLPEREFMVVVADYLLALDRIVTGRWDKRQNIYRVARRDAQQVFKLVRKTLNLRELAEQGKVLYWDDVADDSDYQEFSKAVTDAVTAHAGMSIEIDKFVAARTERFGLGANREEENQAELRYLISEVTMSMYATEILGYTTEIWEKPPARDVPDPLRVLYEQYPEVVESIIGRSHLRKLRFLFPGP